MKIDYHKYFIPVFFVAILILSFLILKPYILAIFWAFFLVYLFYPVYKLLNKKIKNRNLLASIMCVIIVLIILVPLYFIVSILLKETFQLYSYIRISNLIDVLVEHNIDVAPYVDMGVKKIATYLVESITDFLISVPKRILEIVIILFVTFYIYQSGDSFLKKLKNSLPQKIRDIFFREIKNTTDAIVYGQVVTAIVQGGILGTIGFLIFGIPNPFLWGAMMTVLALIPFIGPAFIWVPASIIQYFLGNKFSAIGLFIYGLLIISTIDNILKPKLIGKKANIHPIVILLGIVGGVKLFGVIGLIIGPIILAFFLSLAKIYIKNETQS